MKEENKKLGRPTKYKEKYCEEIVKYFKEKCEPIKSKDKDGKEVLKPASRPPTLYGFAANIGVCIDTIHEWGQKHDAFSDAVKRCKAIQAQFVIEGGMSGDTNTAFSIFMMKNNFNWSDKVQQEVNTRVTLEDLIDQSMKE